MEGKVYKSTGSWYKVKSPEGSFIQCCIKGKFRSQKLRSTNPVVVGDIVDYSLEEAGDETIGVITNIRNRLNYLSRKSVNLSKETHLLASNIDYIFLISTISLPSTTTTFIDRILLMADVFKIEVVLVFNKIDIYDSRHLDILKERISIYNSIGYKCIKTSALTRKNIDQLKVIMKDKNTVFVGHSGVGKSKIINIVEPSLDLKIKSISAYHEQGRHTTTFSEMFDLSFGGSIIDTPGIRGFGISGIPSQDISNYFIDFNKVRQDCKYHNCKHLDEPHCAVKRAVSTGGIAESRYKSYLQIVLEDSLRYR